MAGIVVGILIGGTLTGGYFKQEAIRRIVSWLTSFIKTEVDANAIPLRKRAEEQLSIYIKAGFMLIYGLSTEIETVEKDMEIIHEYLQKEEVFLANKEAIEKVKKVRGIMYRLEDVVDQYYLLTQRNQMDGDSLTNSKWMMMNWKQLKTKLYISTTIIEAKRSLQELGISDPSNGRSSQEEEFVRSDYKNTDDLLLVNMDGPKKEVISLLGLKITKTMPSFVVVKGEPGVGKTKLVDKVYDEVRSEFDESAWVTVSKSYQPADILSNVLQQLQINPNDEPTLHSKKRYLVVLDDVWHDKNSELLGIIADALTFNQEGKIRILLTTRIGNTATNWAAGSRDVCVYTLQPLSEKDAWDLFSRRVFWPDRPNKKFEPILRKILPKCAQLPLLILTVGGLLANKSDKDWGDVCDSFDAFTKDDEPYENTKKILSYSYHDLPYELKPCFLYFGMFPEDSEIHVCKLVWMWIAEGFIVSDSTLEEVAENYMKNLIGRGLVKVVSNNGTFPRGWRNTRHVSPSSEGGLYKRLVKVHDVFHEIIRNKFLELDFSQGVSQNTPSTVELNGEFRRLSVDIVSNTLNIETVPRIPRNICSIRSVVLNYCETFPVSLAKIPPQFATYLRVLHLEGNYFEADDIPVEVAGLLNLRLLTLRIRSHNFLLPEFTWKLSNLETLDIGIVITPKTNRPLETMDRYIHTLPIKLPGGVKRLQKLRHLVISWSITIQRGDLESLTGLQTLVRLNVSNSELVVALKKLTLLRTLHVTQLKPGDVSKFCEALQRMSKLQSLHVLVDTYDTVVNLQYSPPNTLKELVLTANLGTKLPTWIGEANSLVCFVFVYGSNMEQDPLQVLKDLPCLEILGLRLTVYRSLHFGDESDDFKRLRILDINAPETCHYELSGALPGLQILYASETDRRNIPEHIRNVTVFV